MTASRFIALLVIAAALTGCGDEHAVAPDLEGGTPEVVFDLRSLFLTADGREPCVSVVDALTLVVEEESGGRQTRRVELTPEDAVVRIPVEVDPGTLTFTAEVLSNNGTLLYTGTETATVDADDFSVEVELRAVNAVLKACDAPTPLVPIDDAFRGAVQITNRGTRAAAWQATFDSPLCDGDPCLSLTPDSSTTAPGDTTEVFARAEFESTVQAFDVRIESEVGVLDVRFVIQDEPPVARPDTVVVLEDDFVEVDVLSNDLDPEGQALSIEAVTVAEFGETALEEGKVFYGASYAPVWGVTSEDHFAYTVAASGQTATAEVTAFVNPCIRFEVPVKVGEPDVALATENGITALTRDFQFDADTFDFSSAEVALLSGSQTDLGAYLASAAIEFDWAAQPVRYVRFDFLDTTFLVNFAVNGMTRHIAPDLTETMPVPPGVTLRIEDGKFGPGTRLVLEAASSVSIERLLLGGASDQSLLIDDVCFGLTAPGEG